MKRLLLKFKKNWKTNVAGIFVSVAIGLYFFNKIGTEQFVTTTAFLVSIGLFASKDDNNEQTNND